MFVPVILPITLVPWNRTPLSSERFSAWMISVFSERPVMLPEMVPPLSRTVSASMPPLIVPPLTVTLSRHLAADDRALDGAAADVDVVIAAAAVDRAHDIAGRNVDRIGAELHRRRRTPSHQLCPRKR